MSYAVRKAVSLTVLVILLIGLGLLAAMMWTPLPNWLTNKALDMYLEDALGIDVEVGDVGGDLMHIFVLEDIELRTRDGGLQIHIQVLALEYDWKDLISRRWRLQRLIVQKPVISVVSVSRPEERDRGVPPTGKALLPTLPNLEVELFKMTRGTMIDSAGTLLDSVDVRMSFRSQRDVLRIDSFRCHLQLPRIDPAKIGLAGELEINPRDILLSHLEIETPLSRIGLSGQLALRPALTCSLQVRADSVSLKEVARGLKQDGIPDGRVRLDAQIRGAEDGWKGDVQLAGWAGPYDLQRVSARFAWGERMLQLDDIILQSPGLDLRGWGHLDLGSAQPGFESQLSLQNVNLSAIVPRAPATLLSGRLVASGRGRSLETLEANAEVELFAGAIADRSFEGIRGQLQYRRGVVSIPHGLAVSLDGAELFLSGTLDRKQHLDASAKIQVAQLGRLLERSDLSGTMQAQIRAVGPLSDPKVAGLVQIGDLARNGQGLTAARGSFGLGGVVSREEGFFALRFFQGRLGRLNLEDGQIRGRLDHGRIFVDSLTVRGPDGELAGVAQIDVAEGVLEVQLDPFHGSYLGSSFQATAPVKISYREGQTDLLQAQFSWEGGTVAAQGSFGPGSQIQGQVQLDRLQAEPLGRFFIRDHQLSGSLSCDLAVEGSVEDPQGQANILWQGGRFDRLDIEAVRADINYRRGLLTVDTVEVRRGDTYFHGHGYLPLDFSRGGVIPDQPWDLTLVGEGSAVGFLPLVVEDVERLEGSFQTQVQAAGTPGQPRFEGFFHLRDGRLKMSTLGNAIEDLSVQARLDGQFLVIDSLRGITPIRERNIFKKIWSWFFPSHTRGRLEAFGRINLANRAYDLTVKGKRLYVHYLEEQAEAESNANIRITGVKRPLVSGVVTVTRALISRPMTSAPRVAGVGGPPPFDLDLTVQIPKNCWVRNEAAEVELRGQMRVLQSMEGLGLLGNLETIRGSYFFYANNFRIEQGEVIFDVPDDINPLLDVRAWTQVDGERIDLAISGRMKSPTITLTSSSGYGEGDIIALLALRQSSAGLDTVGAQTVVANQAETFFGSYLQEAFNRKASRFLGVDKFKIQPGADRQLDLSMAELTVGTYLSSGFYVEYSRRLSQEGGEQVGVEYSLTRNLSLDGKRDKNGLYRLGFNLQWDY